MRRASLVVLALLSACATTEPEVRPVLVQGTGSVQRPPPPKAGDPSLASSLRAVTARVRKNEGKQVKEELQEALAQQTKKDMGTQLLLAWVDAPSEEAWQEVHRVAMLHRDNPWPPTVSGYIYLQWRGFLDQADGEFLQALKLRPGFVPARVGRADVLRLKGDLTGAKKAYQEVLAEEPDWQEAVAGLGLTQLALKEPEAGKTLQRAYELEPDDFKIIIELARLAVEAGDDPRAIELYGRMLEFDKRNREARVALGKMKERKGDLAGAAAEYELAMNISQDLETARKLATIYNTLKRADDEAKALEKVAALEPENPEPLLRVAQIREAERDLEAAEMALRQASERRPDDPAILYAIAKLVRQTEDLVASIEAFRTAKEKGSAEAKADLRKLENEALLSGAPPSGTVEQVYSEVFRRLRANFLEKQKKNPALGGRMRVRLSVGDDGKASGVEILEDTVHDEQLGALVYFSFKDASYAKKKRKTELQFEFTPAK